MKKQLVIWGLAALFLLPSIGIPQTKNTTNSVTNTTVIKKNTKNINTKSTFKKVPALALRWKSGHQHNINNPLKFKYCSPQQTRITTTGGLGDVQVSTFRVIETRPASATSEMEWISVL